MQLKLCPCFNDTFQCCNQTSFPATGGRICICRFSWQMFYYRDKERKRRCRCVLGTANNPITPLSICNWNVCVEYLIYDEAVEFWLASWENSVFSSCVNVRLELQPPSILEWNREASNQSQVHKSECDKPAACVCVCNYCISSCLIK